MVQGYHEYIASCVPILGEELSCMREIGNPHTFEIQENWRHEYGPLLPV